MIDVHQKSGARRSLRLSSRLRSDRAFSLSTYGASEVSAVEVKALGSLRARHYAQPFDARLVPRRRICATDNLPHGS
jgi:hypothetical protein